MNGSRNGEASAQLRIQGRRRSVNIECVPASQHAVRPALADKFVPTMKASYRLWPAAHTFNFAFVPSEQRVLYMNVVAVRPWACPIAKSN